MLLFLIPSRLVPIRAFTAGATLRFNVRVARKPFIAAAFADPEPDGLFYFCHAPYTTRNNMLCQGEYHLT